MTSHMAWGTKSLPPRARRRGQGVDEDSDWEPSDDYADWEPPDDYS